MRAMTNEPAPGNPTPAPWYHLPKIENGAHRRQADGRRRGVNLVEQDSTPSERTSPGSVSDVCAVCGASNPFKCARCSRLTCRDHGKAHGVWLCDQHTAGQEINHFNFIGRRYWIDNGYLVIRELIDTLKYESPTENAPGIGIKSDQSSALMANYLGDYKPMPAESDQVGKVLRMLSEVRAEEWRKAIREVKEQRGQTAYDWMAPGLVNIDLQMRRLAPLVPGLSEKFDEIQSLLGKALRTPSPQELGLPQGLGMWDSCFLAAEFTDRPIGAWITTVARQMGDGRGERLSAAEGTRLLSCASDIEQIALEIATSARNMVRLAKGEEGEKESHRPPKAALRAAIDELMTRGKAIGMGKKAALKYTARLLGLAAVLEEKLPATKEFVEGAKLRGVSVLTELNRRIFQDYLPKWVNTVRKQIDRKSGKDPKNRKVSAKSRRKP